MTFVRVTGRIDGEAVWATWEDGAIYGDVRLVELARDYVDRGREIELGEGGPLLRAGLDDPWSFTATLASLVDDPVVGGDDLPFAAVAEDPSPD
jgi:hypothetical protein